MQIDICPGTNDFEVCNCVNGTIPVWVDAGFNCFAPVGFYYYQDQNRCDAMIQDWMGLWPFASCDTMMINFQTVDYTGLIMRDEPCMGSDIRLKKGVETLKDSLETLMKLEVVEYDWNENLSNTEYNYFKKNNNLHTIGLIAQNVRQYYPEVVELGGNGYYRINYAKLNSVLVEAIKEQQLFIEDIDKELEYIESKLN
jgi:sucrose-6-phosphate hydrolase SacC (GH32 family)